MNVLRWRSRGDLLRWWRDKVAHISQRALADRLGVARTAVTNWEKGSRLASLDVERIDQALDADGVLAGWLWAFDTPTGLAPRHIWSAVFRGPSTPVWMWIRCSEPDLVVEAEWGLYRFEGEVELGENGFLITLGVSIEESPVVVQLSKPGWVDFGRGDVPPNVPGAPELDPLSMVVPSSATGDFSKMLSSNIAKRFAESPPPEVAELGEEVLKPVESLFDTNRTADRAAKQADDSAWVWPTISDGVGSVDRSRFSTLREARGLSLADTSQRLAELTGTKASKDTLRRFESDVGLPHDRLLPVALDHVLGANGHLAMVELAAGKGSATVNIPRYWAAPVWLEFWVDPECDKRGGDGVGHRVAELYWGSWRRSIDGELPLLLISHGPMLPLRLVVDPSIHWKVGIGRRVGAIPINHGWLPNSIDATQDALTEYQQVLLEALRHIDEHSGDGEADSEEGKEDSGEE